MVRAKWHCRGAQGGARGEAIAGGAVSRSARHV